MAEPYFYKGKWRYREVIVLPGGRKERISGSCTTPNTKGKARQLFHEHVERLTNPNYKPPVENRIASQTFENFAKTYVGVKRVENKTSTLDNKELILKNKINPYFGKLELNSITNATVYDFMSKLKGKRNSIITYLGILRNILKSAHDMGMIKTLPNVPNLKPEMKKVEYLPEPVLAHMLHHAVKFNRAGNLKRFILIAVNAGLRVGEVCGLRWEDINLDARVIHVNRTWTRKGYTLPKSGITRTLPINQTLFDELKGGGVGLVLSRPDGSSCRPDSIWKQLKRLCGKVGYTHAYPHLFRHTFASYLVMRGVPLVSVKELLGHANIKDTMRYAHLAPHALSAAVAMLDAREAQPGDSSSPAPATPTPKPMETTQLLN